MKTVGLRVCRQSTMHVDDSKRHSEKQSREGPEKKHDQSDSSKDEVK